MKKLLYLSFFIVLYLVGCKEDTGKNNTVLNDTIDSVKVQEVEVLNIDINKNDTFDIYADLFAGIDTAGLDTSIKLSDEYWSAYTKEISENWKKMDEIRFKPMDEWINTTLNKYINDTLQLFYPFSGPDFLHAYHLYPNANDYILLAKEAIGEIPELNQLSQKDLEIYLDNINNFLRDIYKRSYFITGNMEKDMYHTKVKGILPILFVFIARTGHEIYDLDRITLDSEGNVIKVDKINKNGIDGVRFYIRKKGDNRIKKLIYFDCDLSDKGMEANPELLKYLKKIRKSNTFVKSASYLMHYGTFSNIRNVTFDISESIFQDDTGIAYYLFDKDKWKFYLYGVYTMPISDFSKNLWQKQLDEAYKDTSKYRGKLPFSLGYHWALGEQNQMLAIKLHVNDTNNVTVSDTLKQ